MRALALFAVLMLPVPAFAVGSEDEEPVTTQTTTACTAGQMWDVGRSICIDPEDDGIDNDARFAAVRELAYGGKADEALRVLDAMNEGTSDRVLTYRGFVLRKAKRYDESLAAYAAALTQNPDNILARSYLGMALVEIGDLAKATEQLTEIRARGGAGSRAEAALDTAIRTGHLENY